jgi:hypothetical protein
MATTGFFFVAAFGKQQKEQHASGRRQEQEECPSLMLVSLYLDSHFIFIFLSSDFFLGNEVAYESAGITDRSA